MQSNIISIPFEIFQHHILHEATNDSLLSLSLTCGALRKIHHRYTKTSSSTQSKSKLQFSILSNLFRNGHLELLLWLQKFLKYPKLALIPAADFQILLEFAVEGTFCFYTQL